MHEEVGLFYRVVYKLSSAELAISACTKEVEVVLVWIVIESFLRRKLKLESFLSSFFLLLCLQYT